MKRIGKIDTYDGYYEHMRNIGYSQHDCESWYECPNCKKEIGAWSLFHNDIHSGDIFECDCGTRLYYH